MFLLYRNIYLYAFEGPDDGRTTGDYVAEEIMI